jgi:hypothetical protein
LHGVVTVLSNVEASKEASAEHLDETGAGDRTRTERPKPRMSEPKLIYGRFAICVWILAVILAGCTSNVIGMRELGMDRVSDS